MADRGMSAAVLSAIAGREIRIVSLVTVDLDTGGIFYLTDGSQAVTWNEIEYSPAGDLLRVPDIEESGTPTVRKLTVTLSGINRSFIATILANSYIDRRIQIWKAFFDDEWNLLEEPLPVYDGRIDRPVIEDDPEAGTCNVNLEVSNAFVDWYRRRGRRNNPHECKIWFPDDEGFEFSDQVTRALLWTQI